MGSDFMNLASDNIADEHLCCAISDKKHQCGVDAKRAWLADRIYEGHVFRKLNAKGKGFIKYSPLETAWVPVVGDNLYWLKPEAQLSVGKRREYHKANV